MKFYCTRWWTSLGIVEFDGNVRGEYATTPATSTSSRRIFERVGTNAFCTLEEAQKDVEKKAHNNLCAKERAVVRAKKLLAKAVNREIKVVT